MSKKSTKTKEKDEEELGVGVEETGIDEEETSKSKKGESKARQEFKALIEKYREQNPVKYERKKESLAKQLAAIK